MNLKRVFNIVSMFSFFTLATSVLAAPMPMAQGGDIAQGRKYNMDPLDMISYYKDGKSGSVKFTCDLEGRNVSASLSPGKNFDGNGYHLLNQGVNGPYVWDLRDAGYNTGNIRIRLLRGGHATIQCKQIA